MARIDGTDASDALDGTAGADRIKGLGGNDRIDAGDGDDTLDGGSGDDTVFGGEGHDELTGWPGSDRLWGDAGNDRFRVRPDDVSSGDEIHGGSGTDTLSVQVDFFELLDISAIELDGVEALTSVGTLAVTAAQLNSLSSLGHEHCPYHRRPS